MDNVISYIGKCIREKQGLSLLLEGNPPTYIQGEVLNVDYQRGFVILKGNDRRLPFEDIVAYPQEGL